MRKAQFPIRTSIAISEKMQATILAISTQQEVSIGEVIRTLLAEALTARKDDVREVQEWQKQPTF